MTGSGRSLENPAGDPADTGVKDKQGRELYINI